MAVVSHVVKKLMKDPDTKSKLGSSLSQQSFCPQFTSISKCYLQQTILKIKKYRAKHNLMKLDAAVQQLKQRYSIRSASKQIGLTYSQLHKLLSFKTNSTRQVTIEDKQCVIETYSQNKITMQFQYCKYAKKHYLRCIMSLAYDDYVTEQLQLGFCVLSKSTVY